MVVKDYMGRVIRIHKNGFVTTYEYPTSGDRRIPISSKLLGNNKLRENEIQRYTLSES